MKDRIIQFLTAEKISPAEFADKIGVQRSSMSHILNGRNYPSAAFIQKMLQAYPDMNPRWLMIGDGKMNMDSAGIAKVTALTDLPNEVPVSNNQTILFPDQEAEAPASTVRETKNEPLIGAPFEYHEGSDSRHSSESVLNQSFPDSGRAEEQEKIPVHTNQLAPATIEPQAEREIEQVFLFYKDKTFSIYRPS